MAQVLMTQMRLEDGVHNLASGVRVVDGVPRASLVYWEHHRNPGAKEDVIIELTPADLGNLCRLVEDLRTMAMNALVGR